MDDELKRLLDANAAETRRLFESSTERIENRFGGVEKRLTALDEKADRTASAVTALDEKADRTASAVTALDEKVDRTTAALTALNEKVDQTAAAVTALDQKMDRTAAETRRHFDLTAEDLRKDIRSIAEALAHSDEKFDGRIDDLEERMARGFEETQAMIRFSHAELDRRIRALEQGFSDLQVRLERLETTPH